VSESMMLIGRVLVVDVMCRTDRTLAVLNC